MQVSLEGLVHVDVSQCTYRVRTWVLTEAVQLVMKQWAGRGVPSVRLYRTTLVTIGQAEKGWTISCIDNHWHGDDNLAMFTAQLAQTIQELVKNSRVQFETKRFRE